MPKHSTLLAGLDDVPWGNLTHLYGSATDVPGLLRDAVGGDDGSWGDLVNHVIHQGGEVCSAAPPLLPYLVRLAETADVRVALRRDALELIARVAGAGRAARPEFVDPAWPLAWSTAVPRIVRLLDDPRASVRARAAAALAHVVHGPDEVREALCAAFERESRTAARVEMVRAVGTMAVGDSWYRTACLAWLHGRVTHDDPQVRLAVVLALRRAEPGHPDPAHFSIAADVLCGTRFTGNWDAVRRARSTAQGLGGHRDEQVALAERLLVHGSARHRLAGLTTAGDALMTWRSAVTLLPAVAARLDDPHKKARRLAVYLLAATGPGAEPWADDLAVLTGDHDLFVAEMAVWGLAHLGDERCVPAVREYLDGSRAAYGSGGIGTVWGFVDRPQLHHVLAGLPAAELRPEVVARLVKSRDPAERTSLAQALRAWRSPDRHPATDPRDGETPRADVRADMRADVEAARAVLNDPMERLAHPSAAFDLWQLTGDHDPAVRLLSAELEPLRTHRRLNRMTEDAVQKLGRIGPPAMAAVPILRAALEDDRRHKIIDGPWAAVQDARIRAELRDALSRIER
ncbi:hypothetical protein [Yinghuangia sp. YIM S09857]|uniref:hypothetical protein n=1 Tax=Yinghuangia sp. YIM S09857 TaxID=3436929 RepID=UPI003F53E1DB